MTDQGGDNETIRRFGHPETLIADYRHWVVLLRAHQTTLGALILAARSQAQSFAALPAGAHAELATVTGDLEPTLKRLFDYRKINYLMLMMVDPYVHFHVLPRYDGERRFDGQIFTDQGWPRQPDLARGPTLASEPLHRLRDHLKGAWPLPRL
jgi:diadenosine tetraphosphate (Ap4A) HIT family hydrolase